MKNISLVKKLLIGFGTLAVLSLIIGFAVSNASAKAEVKAREAAQIQQQQAKDTADAELKVKQVEQAKVVADAEVVATPVAVSEEATKVAKANETNAAQVTTPNQKKVAVSAPAPITPAPVAPKPVVKATPAPDMSEQIAAMRKQKIQAGPGVSLNGRILNLITELQIHKLRSESESTFKSIVQGMMFQENSSLGTLSVKAKQFNSIAVQAIYGSINDDTAISQLQTLSWS